MTLRKQKPQMVDDGHEYLSKEGFEELKKRIEHLKTTRRVEIAQQLEFAKSLGDLSENAEYSEAKEAQMMNESEIARLEDKFSRAKIVEHGTSAEVRIGSTLTVRKNNSPEETFTIVGRGEADPARGRISHESPIGRSFLGHKKNDKIQVHTPKGEIEYLVVSIA